MFYPSRLPSVTRLFLNIFLSKSSTGQELSRSANHSISKLHERVLFSNQPGREVSPHQTFKKNMKYLAAKWSKEALLMYSTFCLKTLDFILYKFQVLIVFTLSNKRPKIFLRVILNVKFCSRRIVHFRCFKVICVVLMVLIALVGNILVILSVILNKSMRSVGKRKKILKKPFNLKLDL